MVRLNISITGQAAEQYFKDQFLEIDLFKGYSFEDTTKVGCGFGFKLVAKEKSLYFGVEVKGLVDQVGNITLTNKEHTVARLLKDRYFNLCGKKLQGKTISCYVSRSIKKYALQAS